MPEKNQTVGSRAITMEPEVLLQITFSPHVKRSLNLKVARSGRTRHTIVLEALRKVGVAITAEDISERQGPKHK